LSAQEEPDAGGDVDIAGWRRQRRQRHFLRRTPRAGWKNISADATLQTHAALVGLRSYSLDSC
jgi:hypothetical protein